MDGFFARGGAVALLTIGVALPAGAQGGSGAAAGPTRERRDTVVRVIDATPRVRMDSITRVDARDRRRAGDVGDRA